jgi:peptidyl-prolyl cis-trans isomerase SurA
MFVSLLLPFSMARAVVLDRIVAVVNDDIITLSELKELETARLRSNPNERQSNSFLTPREEILKNLIDKRIQLQKAKELGIRTSDEAVENTIQRMLEKTGITEETLREKLMAEGLSGADYKAEIRDQMTLSSLVSQEVRSRIVIMPEDLQQYYEKNLDLFKLGEKKHIFRILISIPESATPEEIYARSLEAEVLREAVLSGEDFRSLAIRHSDGPQAGDGGDIGYFAPGEMMPELDRVVSDMNTGDVSPVIRGDDGFTLLKVEDVRGTGTIPFEQVIDKIQAQVYQEILERRYDAWIKELREKAYVEIKL